MDVDAAVKFLNQMAALDKQNTRALIDYHVVFSDTLAEHPHICPSVICGKLAVGLLSVLNGIIEQSGSNERIAAIYDGDIFLGFMKMPLSLLTFGELQ